MDISNALVWEYKHFDDVYMPTSNTWIYIHSSTAIKNEFSSWAQALVKIKGHQSYYNFR